MLLLLAGMQVLTRSVSPSPGGWAGTEQILWASLIDQLAAGAMVLAMMPPAQVPRGQMPAMGLAAGLVVMTIVGMAALPRDPLQALGAQVLALILSLALAAVLTRTKQWRALCAAAVALIGALIAAGAWYSTLSALV